MHYISGSTHNRIRLIKKNQISPSSGVSARTDAVGARSGGRSSASFGGASPSRSYLGLCKSTDSELTDDRHNMNIYIPFLLDPLVSRQTPLPWTVSSCPRGRAPCGAWPCLCTQRADPDPSPCARDPSPALAHVREDGLS